MNKALAVLMCVGLLAVAAHGLGHIPTPFGMMPETWYLEADPGNIHPPPPALTFIFIFFSVVL
jgi:hypothetical protein